MSKLQDASKASMTISVFSLVARPTYCADAGWEGVLRNLTSTQPELGADITSLMVTADTSQSDIAHICITDLHNTRWQVPSALYPSLGELLYKILRKHRTTLLSEPGLAAHTKCTRRHSLIHLLALLNNAQIEHARGNKQQLAWYQHPCYLCHNTCERHKACSVWPTRHSVWRCHAEQRQRGFQKQDALYDLTYNSTPFSFSVTRANRDHESAIFSTVGQRLIFKVHQPCS